MKFLRYPGGKGKLLSFLVRFLPGTNTIHGTYIEPFVGGGAVYLCMQPGNAILSDLNKELIELYRGIRNYPHHVWKTFCSFPEGKIAYYKIRDEKLNGRHLYYRAARTLYLNRTCFKGMWRHNPDGKFNVGYGGEERRWVITRDNILELSRKFKKAEIFHCDFESVLSQASRGDFIFLDPPYSPGEKEMRQEHYINGRFPFEEQVRLSKKLKDVSVKKNVKWLMTNSSHPEIRALYKGFYFVKIPKGTSRTVGVFKKNSGEAIIANYPI